MSVRAREFDRYIKTHENTAKNVIEKSARKIVEVKCRGSYNFLQ